MSKSPRIEIIGIEGIGEVKSGDDIAELIVEAIKSGPNIEDGDVLVVTQKIVSKAEGRVVATDPSDPTAKYEVVAGEAAEILRRRGNTVIAETRHGFVCANAGVDSSNTEPGTLCLLPLDPDLSARRIRVKLKQLTGREVAVIVSDTFGRAWRVGQTDVAIGVAGMLPLNNYAGTKDSFGNEMRVTNIAIADELAGAAELVMGKADNIPVAIVRGTPARVGRGNARQLVRPAAEDLFR